MSEGENLASEEGKRAVLFYAEQIWEATRGLVTAYRVDTGHLDFPDPPAWDDLAFEERVEFVALTERAAYAQRSAVMHITSHERRRR